MIYYEDRHGESIEHGTIFRWWAGGNRDIPQLYVAMRRDRNVTSSPLIFLDFPQMTEIELVTATFSEWAEVVSTRMIDSILGQLNLTVKSPEGKDPRVSILFPKGVNYVLFNQEASSKTKP